MSKKSLTIIYHKPVYAVLAVVLIGIIGLGGIFLTLQSNQRPTPLQHTTQNSPTSSAATVTPQPTIALSTYTSNALGISFSYPSPTAKWNVTPHEAGSKIFFGSNTAQFIQVFHLPQPATSIEDAIRNTVLKGYSAQDCTVVSGVSGVKQQFASNIEVAYITFPGNDFSDMHQAAEYKCPKGYIKKGGSFYFMLDKDHPTTLLFISESQQPLAGAAFPITSSIKVLD